MVAPTKTDGDPVQGSPPTAPVLSEKERLRYSRHLIMPEIGEEGQKRLKAARVLLIGLGGLGSPVGLYLAACGIGELGLVDFDTVELTNLHRQVLYADSDIHASKVDVARVRLQGMNPHIRLKAHEVRLTSENALAILRGYDVIVDGSDNFPTRYLVNDSCVLLGKPYVYGSIFRFDGQVSVFDARVGPCYRCLYPVPPPPGLVPSCAEGGVLGVLPGIVGSLQALETIKLIAGAGEPLIGRLLLFDALKPEFRQLRVRKDPACPICGSNPTIRELVDYEKFCGGSLSPHETREEERSHITAEELKMKFNSGTPVILLDVREPFERAICSLGGVFIPLNELQHRLHELHPSQEIVVYCKSGSRSASAVEILHNAGYPLAKSLIGGIDGWAKRIDSSLPRY